MVHSMEQASFSQQSWARFKQDENGGGYYEKSY